LQTSNHYKMPVVVRHKRQAFHHSRRSDQGIWDHETVASAILCNQTIGLLRNGGSKLYNSKTAQGLLHPAYFLLISTPDEQFHSRDN